MRVQHIRDSLPLVPSLVAAAAELPTWFDQPHNQVGGVDVPADFLGINVATTEDPTCDDFVIECLRELGIGQVRLTYSAAEDDFTERFLQRLLSDRFDVLLSIVPVFSSAEAMASDPGVQDDWRRFVRQVLERYGASVHAVEIGNTPNRPRWSGFTPASYLRTWQIAAEVASEKGVSLAGANVSDFEPAFNSGYLRAMSGIASRPSIQTTNLFVERARQPEAYDRKALGPMLSNLVRLNLVKKVHILRAITERWLISRFYVTYTCWTRPRLSRWSVSAESKGADYLARYIALAAATGQIDRLYWGPLIDGRDGLVYCEGEDYPEIDNVTHYRAVNGVRESFEKSPSYYAMRFMAELVQGTRCLQAVTAIDGVNHVIFISDAQEHHILWATDRLLFDFKAIYPSLDKQVVARDVSGKQLENVISIGESPVVLTWPTGAQPARPSEAQIRDCPQVGPTGTRYGLPENAKPLSVSDDSWVGIVHGEYACFAERLYPRRLLDLPVVHTLRDKRNKLWTVDIDGRSLVVKENRARGIKRLSYYFLRSKGLRHWNNAHEFLRRGVNTPKPIGFFEKKTRASVENNYYLSEYIADTHSLRDLFTAFNSGAEDYQGISKADWLARVGRFTALMHKRRITHTDLSSGNVLFTMNEGADGGEHAEVSFYAIDIGRARFDDGHNPYADIARVCYKLAWPDRETLMASYLTYYRLKRKGLWRWWCRAYDYKLALKKGLKGNLMRARKKR